MIEAQTYRLGPHTTADDPTKYRPQDHEATYTPLDPLPRLEAYLRSRGVEESFFEEIETEAKQGGQTVRDYVLNSKPEDFETYLDRVYAEPHQQVEDDRAFYRAYTAGFEEE